MSDEKAPLVDNYTMSNLVTVNEARKDRGLPPLTKDGKPDPDGDLTVNAYNAAKRSSAYDCFPKCDAPVRSGGERTPFRNMK